MWIAWVLSSPQSLQLIGFCDLECLPHRKDQEEPWWLQEEFEQEEAWDRSREDQHILDSEKGSARNCWPLWRAPLREKLGNFRTSVLRLWTQQETAQVRTKTTPATPWEKTMKLTERAKVNVWNVTFNVQQLNKTQPFSYRFTCQFCSFLILLSFSFTLLKFPIFKPNTVCIVCHPYCLALNEDYIMRQ